MPVYSPSAGLLSLWHQDERGQEINQTLCSMLREASAYHLESQSQLSSWERPASDPLQQTLAILAKISTRGLPTWVDHEVERELREASRAAGWLEPNTDSVQSEIYDSNTIHAIPPEADLRSWVEDVRKWLWAAPLTGSASIADRRALDGIIPEGSSSDEEWLFFKAFTDVVGPCHAWRLRPQPLFEELFGEIDPDIGPGRRVDFAFLVGDVKWVFEIDALMKSDAGYELVADNQRRDKALLKHGWKVARITTAECREHVREWIQAWWGGAPAVSTLDLAPEERALSPNQRAWLLSLNTAEAQPKASPAWSLIAIPYYVQAITTVFLHLVRIGFLAPGIDQRILILAEQPAPFGQALGQFYRMWNALRQLNPALPEAPRLQVDVVGGVPTLDVWERTECFDLRYVVTIDSHYDLRLSFGPSLFEHVSGPLEQLYEGTTSGPVVHWRRTFAPVRQTQLWTAAPLFHLPSEEASAAKEFFEEADKCLEQGTALPMASERTKNIWIALTYYLRTIFRKKEPLPGQFAAVVRVLAGKSTLVLLPTGSGKSLVYQLSALLLPGMAIVVDPLVSLMQDQVQNLQAQYIDRCIQLSSGTDVVDRVTSQKELGEGLQAFVFLSPHRFQITEFREALGSVARRFPITLAVIDEAHCVSEWGHDFMTPYLLLGRNIRSYAKYEYGDRDFEPVFLGLTGTASFAVLTDVQLELGVLDEESIILPKSFDRKKLRFEVLPAPSDPKKRLEQLRSIRPTLADKFQTTPATFFTLDKEKTSGGLIFCPHVNGALGVKAVANGLGWSHFYGGSKPKEFAGSERDWNEFKQQVQKKFKNNNLQELVTTKSFGMGIDKPNIRYTIHFVMPGSVEAFYQEAGRAGRDGKEAWCYVLFNKDQPDDDLKIQRFFLEKNFPDPIRERDQADLLWRRVLAQELRNLPPGGSKRIQVGYSSTDQDPKAKALCRLVWLGVVENYSVDYRARHFWVTAKRSTPQEVQDALAGYFRRYMFEGDVTAKVSTVPLTSTAEAVTEALRLLIDFAYVEIRAKREQAMKTLAQLCHEFKDESSFRQGILDYLQESEFSVELRQSWVKASWNDLGEPAVLAMLTREKLKDRDAARRLVGSVRRLLDDTPRHVPLRVLSVLARARICESYSDEFSVIEEAQALVQSLLNTDLQGVDDPIDVFLFVIEQVDILCTEPFEVDQESPAAPMYIPSLYSELTKVFEQSWGNPTGWRHYLQRLKTLPYTYSRRITAGLAADLIQRIQDPIDVFEDGGSNGEG